MNNNEAKLYSYVDCFYIIIVFGLKIDVFVDIQFEIIF